MKQNGLAPIYLIIGFAVLVIAVSLIPIPYYQKYVLCFTCPGNMVCPPCPKPGWKLGNPLWKQLFNKPTKIMTTTATPSPIPNENNNTDSIKSNWKTYTNTHYGYSLEYPEDWSLQESKFIPEVNGYITDIMSPRYEYADFAQQFSITISFVKYPFS